MQCIKCRVLYENDRRLNTGDYSRDSYSQVHPSLILARESKGKKIHNSGNIYSVQKAEKLRQVKQNETRKSVAPTNTLHSDNK